MAYQEIFNDSSAYVGFTNTPGQYGKTWYDQGSSTRGDLGSFALTPYYSCGQGQPIYTDESGDALGVPLKWYSCRVSPLLGWHGQEAPTGNPAQLNPTLPLSLDFNSMDLYTYEGVTAPSGEYGAAPVANVYDNSPIASAYPQIDRAYSFWGKSDVEEEDQLNWCRPVAGSPMRIQKIPLYGGSGGPLIGLDGETVMQAGGCAVSGYFYTLATDPVFFTGDVNSGDLNPEVRPWIDEDKSGFLPLSTTCGGGGLSMSGVTCYGDSFPCTEVDCLGFSTGDFYFDDKFAPLPPVVQWGGFSVSGFGGAPCGESGTSGTLARHDKVKTLSFGTGFQVTSSPEICSRNLLQIDVFYNLCINNISLI